MRPEELTSMLRVRVKRDLTRRLTFALDSAEKDPTTSLADLMVAFQVTTAANAATLARVVHALVRDPALEGHMTAVMAGYKAHPELEASLHRLASDPDSLPDADLDAVLELLLNDDRLITAPIKIILENQEIRAILNVPDDMTFPRYVEDLRRALRESTTYDEFMRKVAIAPEGLFFSALTAVAVAVLATVATVVHAVAVAVTYAAAYAVALKAVVFTVAGQTGSSVPDGVVPPQTGPLESICTNDSDTVAWVVVVDQGRRRRVPLMPGRDTRELGLRSVAGVLVGGAGNPVQVLRRNGVPVPAGIYPLRRNEVTPGLIRLVNGVGEVAAEVNDAQREAERPCVGEFAGAATQFDQEEISMATVAAAVPAGFDYAATMRSTIIARRFDRTMQFVDALQRLRATT